MDRDRSEQLTETVLRACEQSQPITISGTGTKSFLNSTFREDPGRLLSTTEHCGIVDYLPDELVVTVRAGTTLKDLEHVLGRENQMLAFEPPVFNGPGTVGGVVACGLSGPGRPWRGSVRDFVLGVVMVNGLGEKLRFGGQVVKNVAGYDVSRLQVGAFGTLGLLLDVSLRVLPAPQAEQTRVLELDAQQALDTMRNWAATPLPLTGACHVDGRLYVRLSGAEVAVVAAGRRVGGQLASDGEFWEQLNNHQLALFREPGRLMRRLVAPASPLDAGWKGIVDWAGSRRWQVADSPDDEPAYGIHFGEGYATSVCACPRGDDLLGGYQRRLKAAFDPGNILNSGVFNANAAS